MTEMFGEAWSPMSVPDLAPDDDDDLFCSTKTCAVLMTSGIPRVKKPFFFVTRTRRLVLPCSQFLVTALTTKAQVSLNS